VVRSDPYEVGWLYAVRGEPEEGHLDVHGYIAHLGAIIQRMAKRAMARKVQRKSEPLPRGMKKGGRKTSRPRRMHCR